MVYLRFIRLMLVIFCMVLLQQTSLYSQKKILFRYNSDYPLDSALQTPVVMNDVDINIRVDDEEELARGPDGWGYASRQTAYFYSDSSSIRSASNINLSLFGTLELSGELWLKPFTSDGLLFSWDDSAKAQGINLFLDSGHVTLGVRLMETMYSLTSQTTTELYQWIYINWTCLVKNDSIKQKIYINGALDAQSGYALASPVGFLALSSPVQIGLTSDTISPVNGFSGEIHAVNMKSYIPDKRYLMSRIPKDGSTYFGIPSYHDYALNSLDKNCDLRIAGNSTPVIETAFVPYLNDAFIPQGITNSYEDEEFQAEGGMIYISMYHKTETGVIRTKRSIIVELDPEDGFQVRRCFRLRGIQQTNHNGGIAYKNGYIYVASAGNIERYPIPEFEGDRTGKYQDLTTSYTNYYQVQSVASFMTYFQDSVWVGDYRTSSQATPYLYGYPLDEQGNVVISASPVRYRLPFQSQGVAWRSFQGDAYLFISTSGGDAGSKVSRYHRSKLSRTDIPQPDVIFHVPAGGEDLSFDASGRLLNVSESGARYFQKRSSPWKTFYPFIFSISEDELYYDIIPSDVKNFRKKNVPELFQLQQNYPNPFNQSTMIRYYVHYAVPVHMEIFNIIGQKVKTLVNRFNDAGHYHILWDGTDENDIPVPGGIYFYTVRAGDEVLTSRKMIVLR